MTSGLVVFPQYQITRGISYRRTVHTIQNLCLPSPSREGEGGLHAPGNSVQVSAVGLSNVPQHRKVSIEIAPFWGEQRLALGGAGTSLVINDGGYPPENRNPIYPDPT